MRISKEIVWKSFLLILAGLVGGLIVYGLFSWSTPKNYTINTEKITEKQVYLENSSLIESIKKISPSIVTVLTKETFEKLSVTDGNLVQECFNGFPECQNVALVLSSDGLILYGGLGQEKDSKDLVALDFSGKDYQLVKIGKIRGFSIYKLVNSGELVLDPGKRSKIFNMKASVFADLKGVEIGQRVVGVVNGIEGNLNVAEGIISQKVQFNRGLLVFNMIINSTKIKYSNLFTSLYFDLSGDFLSAMSTDGSELNAEEVDALLHRLAKKESSIEIADLGMKCLVLDKQVGKKFGYDLDYGCLVMEYLSNEGKVIDGGVKKGSLADKAGLKSGDVVVEVDGNSLLNASLIETVMNKAEGETMNLSVLRNKKIVDLVVKF